MSTMLIPEITSPGTPLDEVGQVLEKAADLIDKHGWFKGNSKRWIERDGKTCAAYAISLAGEDGPYLAKAFIRLGEHLGLQNLSPTDISHVSVEIILWNDAQTDSRDVVRALREAAAS